MESYKIALGLLVGWPALLTGLIWMLSLIFSQQACPLGSIGYGWAC